MSTDASQHEQRNGLPRRLPKLVAVDTRRVPFEAPKLRHFTSSLSKYDKAIAFDVETDGPLPMFEAVTPVLYVGDTILTEGKQLEEAVYRFLAFEERRLEPGAPITLAYPGTPAETRPETRFRYAPPSGGESPPEVVQ